MQQDVAAGFYTISVLEGGEGALDPLSTATMEQARCLCVCFFFCIVVTLQESLVRRGGGCYDFPRAYRRRDSLML